MPGTCARSRCTCSVPAMRRRRSRSSCTSSGGDMPLNKEIDSHHWVDGMNELQIRERSHLSNDEVVEQLRAVGPGAVKGRWRTPLPMRHLPIPFGPPIGWVRLEVSARRRLHPRRVGAPHRHLRGNRSRLGSHRRSRRPARRRHRRRVGVQSTASRSSSCSRGRPAASSAKASAASASRSTPSNSFRSCPGVAPAPACWPTPFRSNRKRRIIMETRVDEIADHIYRFSTLVPDIGPTGFTLQSVPDRRRRAAAVPHRAARDVPVGVRGDRDGDAARTPALDHVRSPRGRRVRRDEPVPRRVAPTRRSRTARSVAWCR